MAKSAKHGSGGGGINTRQHVKTPIKAGPPSTKKISESAAANQGLSKGNHANSRTLRRPSDPLFQSRPAQVPSGNQVGLNAAGAKAGPGAGRILHGQAG